MLFQLAMVLLIFHNYCHCYSCYFISIIGDCFRNKCIPNGSLKKGDFLISENGKYKAIFQEDGNLQVMYKNLSVVWSSNTGNSGANEVHFDQSGNLMILGTSWSTDTADSTPKAETLVMGNDGDLQLLSKDNERVWHSGARMISANGKSIIIVSQSSISKSVMKSRQRQVTC